MKGIKIEISNYPPMYWFRPCDVIDAIAHTIYYTANPESKMCIPNCAYEKAEKVFKEWSEELRDKEVEVTNKKNCKDCCRSSCKNYNCDISTSCESFKEKESGD